MYLFISHLWKRGGSNEYPQSMFWSKNKKKYVYPSKPHFVYIKVGCKGVFITRTCYPDELLQGIYYLGISFLYVIYDIFVVYV